MIRFYSEAKGEFTEPQYKIILEGGGVMVGIVQKLKNQENMRCCVSTVTKKLFPQVKKKEWDVIVRAMVAMAEDEDTGGEASEVGALIGWLTDYLDEHVIADIKEASARSKKPFTKEGSIGIFGSDFREWIRTRRGMNVTGKWMGSTMRRAGSVFGKIDIYEKEKHCNRAVWWINGVVADATDVKVPI